MHLEHAGLGQAVLHHGHHCEEGLLLMLLAHHLHHPVCVMDRYRPPRASMPCSEVRCALITCPTAAADLGATQYPISCDAAALRCQHEPTTAPL